MLIPVPTVFLGAGHRPVLSAQIQAPLVAAPLGVNGSGGLVSCKIPVAQT